MKAPAAQEGWECRFPFKKFVWEQVWKLKAMYTSPRDVNTWLKLKHRNLYVAKSDGEWRMLSTFCRLEFCSCLDILPNCFSICILPADCWLGFWILYSASRLLARILDFVFC